jgi:hypothetical protein
MSGQASKNQNRPEKIDKDVQTEIVPKDYIPARIVSKLSLEADIFPSFMRNSHSVTALGVVILIIYYKCNYIFFTEEMVADKSERIIMNAKL